MDIGRPFVHRQMQHVLQKSGRTVGAIHVGLQLAHLALDQPGGRILGKVIVLLNGLRHAVEFALKEVAPFSELAQHQLGNRVRLGVTQHYIHQAITVFPHRQESIGEAQGAIENTGHRRVGFRYFAGIDKAQTTLCCQLARHLVRAREPQLDQEVAHGHLLDLLLLQHVVDGHSGHQTGTDQGSAQGRARFIHSCQALCGSGTGWRHQARGLQQ